MYCTCLVVCISTCTYVGAVLVLLYLFTSILFLLPLNTRRCWWPAPCSSSSWTWAWLVTPRWTPPSMGRWRTSYTAYGSANQLSVKPLLLSVCEDEHWTGADTDDLLPGRNQAGHGHDMLQQDGNPPPPPPPISGEVEDFVHCLRQCEPSIFTSSCCLCVRMNNLEKTAMSDVCLLPVGL